MAKSLRNLSLIAFLFAIICSQNLFAQLSGTKNIPGDYASLDAAITDLNTQGVGAGGVVLNVVAANPQSAPAGGYSITATGTVANPITITGNANTITASNALVVGNLNDGIFKLIGSDYVTIQGFTMLENAANLVTAAATNNMTEWGVALLYATQTDGAKNNLITDNTIMLGATYQNAFGIYSNVRHSPLDPLVAADITNPSGANSDNRFTLNSISSVNIGICVVGSTTGANMDSGLQISQTAVSSYGLTATFSAFVSVNASVNGIYLNNQLSYLINLCPITSSIGGVVTTGTIRGIYVQTTGTLPAVGSYTRTITNNVISVTGGNAGNVLVGIANEGGNATTALTISSNTFQSFGYTVAGTGATTFISNTGATQSQDINSNVFNNITINSTGAVTFITNSVTVPIGGFQNVNSNSIQTAFAKTLAGGTITFFTSNASSVAGTLINNNNNNFSNITVTGATTIAGWSNTDGGTPSKTISNNTFSNITGGTSAITAMTLNFGENDVFGNTISNITNGAAITGISRGASGAINTNDIYSNTVTNLSSTAGVVTGIAIAGTTATINNVSGNKVYNLQSNNATGTCFGITISSGTTNNVFNNIVGDLRAPSTSSTTDAVRGINITSTTATSNLLISNNSVYLNASSIGANFNTSGIFHTLSATATTASLSMRGNVIVNISTANGTGKTSAFRRSASTSLNNYNTASNYNLFYAGVSGPANVLYYDGTNFDETIGALKSRLTPREANSATENPTFQSVTGSDPNFLHPDTLTPTFMESGATTIAGITSDYDGTVRYPGVGYPNNPSFPAFAPDMGAFEFGGIWLDLSGPSISYTALANTANTSDRSLVATITDPSGVATGVNGPRVYYKKSIDVVWQIDASPSVAGNDYTFSLNAAALGGIAPGDVIEYYVAAQDLNGFASTSPLGGSGSNPPGTTPPGVPNSYLIVSPPLSGDYTVGTVAFNRATGLNLKLETFTRTVTKNIEVVNDGPVINDKSKNTAQSFDVLSAQPRNTVATEVTEEYKALAQDGKLYNGPLVVYNSDNSAIYATVSAAVADLNTRGVNGPTRFLLTDASYTEVATVTISITSESLPTATNTVTFKPQPFVDAEITVNSTGVAISVVNNYVIFDGSNTEGGTTRNLTLTNSGNGANSGALFVTGGNCTVKHTNARSSLYLYGYGIVFSGTAAGNGIVTNCGLTRAAIGIQSQGSLNTISITNNDVGAADSLNTVANLGIGILNTTNFTVNNNRVVGINRWATSNAVGILVGFSAGIMATPGTITQNTISNVKHMGYDGAAWGAWGIQLATTEAASDILIANNSISDIYSQGDGGTTGAEYVGNGIYITSGGGYKIYNNSINLFGELTDPGAASVMRNAGIVIAAVTGAGNLDIRNNIFVNGQTYLVAAASKRTYGIYSVAANTVFTQLDYNDYYGYGVDGALGYLGSERTTIVAWRTASGKDVNSTTWDPGFTSPTNLLPNPAGGACWGVNGTGYPLTAVPTDISGNSRSTTIANGPTDMGAYEFTPSTPPPVATQTITADGTYDYAIGGRLFASVTITGYVADAAAFDISMLHYSGVTPPGGTTQEYANSYDSIWVSAGSFSAASYEVRLYVNDNNMRNIANANNIVLAKSNDGGALWTPSPGTTNGFTAGSPGYGYATGLTTFSLFTITSTDNPLPVELASFTSSIDKRSVTLKWSTASELNNSGFDVERKSIGTENSWSKVGSVAGAGSSTTIKNYSFTENNLNTGKYNYRLKQIDFNGNFKYYDLSGEVIVGVPTKFEISQNYPNPFNPSTKINFDLPFDSKVQIKIFDITGREVFQLVNEARAAGYHTVQFNASSMASGVYFYMINANGGNQSYAKTMKMVLVK